MQKRATRLVPTFKNLPHQDRLRRLDLPTLAYRRSKGDMVETFKIMNCVYDRSVSEGLFMEQDGSVIRGHEKRIFKQKPRLDIRIYSFSNTVVNSWNSPIFCSECCISAGFRKEIRAGVEEPET